MDFSLWLGVVGSRKDGGLEGILGRWSVVSDGNHSLVHFTDLQLASAGCPALLSGSGFPYSAIDPQERKEREKKERMKEVQSRKGGLQNKILPMKDYGKEYMYN